MTDSELHVLHRPSLVPYKSSKPTVSVECDMVALSHLSHPGNRGIRGN